MLWNLIYFPVREKMNTNKLFFAFALLLFPGVVFGASKCSRMDLTRCLDSVCAINVGSNPAARCQYCGTSSAGTPPNEKKGMQTLSVGQTSKNTISAKELKDAPDDPGERYAWATVQCIKKLGACTPDDVADAYDKLIEQSCTAAGISAQVSALNAAAKKKKSESACQSEVRACVVDATRCASDYRGCREDVEFDKVYSECTVITVGCDDYLASIRKKLTSARDTAYKNADALLEGIIASYQSARESRLLAAQNGCKNNADRDACVDTVCSRSFRNKCAPGFENERSMAVQMCKFYDIACNLLD